MGKQQNWYCRRCGNQNQKKFKTIPKGTYCTACLEFGRMFVGAELAVQSWRTASSVFADYDIPYALTHAQQECAFALIDYIGKRQNVLVYACCGAGKTEIVFPLITHCLKNNKKVGIAVPRRDVVIELQKRIAAAYPKKTVCAVYGGNADVLDADIIICTTHQLYRYPQTFEVLILDEVDAFPYKGNTKLQKIAMQASKGNFVFLSATPDHVMKKQVQDNELRELTLFKRPHGHPLCVPEVKIGLEWMLYIHLFRFLLDNHKKTVLLFMPSIASAKQMYRLVSFWRKTCLFTSQTEDRAELMENIRNKMFQVVVCTTVLERGITIADVQVLVWHANHSVFDEATLIQILGRVGRTKEAYEGRGLLLCQRRSKSVDCCVASLKKMNAA